LNEEEINLVRMLLAFSCPTYSSKEEGLEPPLTFISVFNLLKIESSKEGLEENMDCRKLIGFILSF